MAPGTPTASHEKTSGRQASHAIPVLSSRPDPRHRSINPDLNRPLPPPPPPPLSATDHYEIPSLRRKPVSDSSDTAPSRHGHNRSFSHPFPSLFGSKRSDRKHQARGENDSSGANTRDGCTEDVKAKNQVGETTSQRVDRQPVTGKCMTCDSTVRWPQGLKVFRCTTCLTINDLEYNPSHPHDTAGPSNGTSAPRRIVPISLEKTRSLIDRCIRGYLDSLLHDDTDPSPVRGMETPSVDESFLIDGSPPEGLLFEENGPSRDSPPSSPTRPSLKPRSPSESTLTSLHHQSPANRDPSTTNTSDPFSTSLPANERGRYLPRGEVYGHKMNDHIQHTSPLNIFRPVEEYISESFVGCETLNHSFLTSRLVHDTKLRSHSNSQPRRPATESAITPVHEPDVFLSGLDAKTLLLGDVAENGSWWLGGPGGRQSSSGKDNHQARDRSPERLRALNARHSRINWSELTEWYRVLVFAGETWEQQWDQLGDELTNTTERQLWQSMAKDTIRHDVVDSRLHLQRSLLKITENLLKRPRQPLKHAEDCRFLLILLANPLLTPQRLDGGKISTIPLSNPHSLLGRSPDRHRSSPSKRFQPSGRRPGSLGHHSGVIKRILGLIANLPNEIHQCLALWFSRYSDAQFQRAVEMIGSFVTYRLSRQQRRPAPEPVNPTEGLVPSFSDTSARHASQLHAALGARKPSTSAGNAEGKPKISVYSEDWQVRVAARVMALLFQANVGHTGRKRDASATHEQRHNSPGLNAKHHAYSHGQIVPISNFYNTMLDYADLASDFEAWETTKTKFTFCQYPFFLSIYAKIHILEFDARRQMEVKAREAFFDAILSRKAVSQYLVLKVRRDCLVEDSLRNVSEAVGSGGNDLKKGLRIDFLGEEGIDAGGLRKEWFLLLVREIFDPFHGLFVYDDDSQYCYFNPYCFESSEQFFLVGVLLGLAIYNSTILDVAFPPFVFKKMLASAPSSGDKLMSTPKVGHGYTLEDLAEFRPALARGLRQLLEYEGDVQETFCRDFVAEMDRYGEILQIPLFPGGEKRPVTNSNRKEFVDLYVHYLLDTAVARQYEPFKRGFFTVCGGNALSLFRPEEIELLVRGSDEHLDVASLRAVATYEGWPKEDGPPDQQLQVIWFWDFFSRASPLDQRKILSFITGSDRIPAMGATNLVIRVQLLREAHQVDVYGRPLWQPVERFPIARTCFNSIALYKYGSREKLEQKLWTAVTESEGFGLK